LFEDVPLRRREAGEDGAPREQDDRPRPEDDVRGQVFAGTVVPAAPNVADVVFDPVQLRDRCAAGEPDRCGAERAHRRACDERLLDADLAPRVVGWPQQWMSHPERSAQLTGEDTETDESERCEPV